MCFPLPPEIWDLILSYTCTDAFELYTTLRPISKLIKRCIEAQFSLAFRSYYTRTHMVIYNLAKHRELHDPEFHFSHFTPCHRFAVFEITPNTTDGERAYRKLLRMLQHFNPFKCVEGSVKDWRMCIQWDCTREDYYNGSRIDVKLNASGCRMGLFGTSVNEDTEEVRLDWMPMCVTMLRKDRRCKMQDWNERVLNYIDELAEGYEPEEEG